MLRYAQYDNVLPSVVTLNAAKHEGAVPDCRALQGDMPPPIVTLSKAKGLSRWAWRCFAKLSMTGLYAQRDSIVCSV